MYSASGRVSRKSVDSHVLLLALVETSDTFDRHVVGFGSSRGENDIFRVRSNQIGNMLYKLGVLGEFAYDGLACLRETDQVELTFLPSSTAFSVSQP